MSRPLPRGRRAALVPLLTSPRFEVLPLPGVVDRVGVLPGGATVTVTASPSRGVEATGGTAAALCAAGVRAVPHLAARQIPDRARLRDALVRLEDAGVREIFVVAGDAREPVGEFADGLSLLRAMDEIGHRMTDIGVPSYPGGHHLIRNDTLWQALRMKERFATYTVTQLCLDADRVCAFAAEARSRGISLPVVAGIPGAVAIGTLLRVSVRIGVSESARFVRSHRSVPGDLLRPHGYRPDGLVRALGAHVAAGRCRIEGLHLYTFNQVEPTLRWLHQAQRRAAA